MDIAGRVGDDEGVDGIGILPAAPRMVRSVGLMWCMMPRAASATIGWIQRPQSAGLDTVSLCRAGTHQISTGSNWSPELEALGVRSFYTHNSDPPIYISPRNPSANPTFQVLIIM